MNLPIAASGRRTASSVKSLDRRWRHHFMALAIGPLHLPTVADLRHLFADLMDARPHHPFVATIAGDGTRWAPVPRQDRAAHLERMVIAGEDFPVDDIAGYMDRHRPPLDSDMPLTIVVGPEFITVYATHLLGDGNTFSHMVVMIAQADAAGIADLENRASFRDAFGLLASGAKVHRRDWARRALGRGDDRPDAGTTSSRDAGVDGAPPSPVPPAADPRGAAVVLTTAQLAPLSRWRNTNCRGVSITAVLASAIYRSLVEQGIPVDGTGVNALVDVRRYLPAERQSIHGNLAQNVYLAADLSDPVAIDSALDEAIASARSVPGLIADVAMDRWRPRPSPSQTLGPITMSLSVMPGLPGVTDLPWLRATGRRFVGYAYPARLRGISVSAVRLRDRMELTATFDGRAMDHAAVERALSNVRDADRLLSASL